MFSLDFRSYLKSGLNPGRSLLLPRHYRESQLHNPERKERLVNVFDFGTYGGQSLKSLSGEDTPPVRAQILESKDYECKKELSPKDTNLVRTELFGRRCFTMRRGLHDHMQDLFSNLVCDKK